ncbi:O-antigen/teichoic acid export membrane protein [Actinoallomurus bryophytorum]|uniref:O-antigen/teichoic acid export membrane protein n=2 Tax=Actinoallomurus bryophytorum TaxID=1490222 RepID=A0A543BTQ7_9ACTN|nr:O-antigen/teichoic acid export membrane protein [Actinoallomurus bryophytorum]
MLTCAAKFALGALSTVFVTRELGPERRGAYTVLVTIATVALILAHLSVESAHTSLWSRAAGRRAIAANALLLGLGMGGVCAVGTALVTALDPSILPVPGYGLLLVALLSIPCNLSGTLLNNVLVLSGRIGVVNWGGLLAVGVYCGTLVLLTVAGMLTLGWVIVMWTLSAAVPAVVAMSAVRPRFRDRDRALARRAIGMGLRYHPGHISLYLLLRVDVLILNALTSRTAVGLYSVAVMLMDLTRTAADSVAQVTLHQQMGDDHDSATALTVRTTRLATLLAAGSVGLMCAAAPFLIPLVYGSAFAGSLSPLLALAPGLVALGATRTLGSFLLRLHRPLVTSCLAFGVLVANVALNLLLIPMWGIVGCALASSAGYCALAALQTAWFVHVTGVPYRRLVPGPAELRYLAVVSVRLVTALTAALRRGPSRQEDGAHAGRTGRPPG